MTTTEVPNRLTIDRIRKAQQQTGLPFCTRLTYHRFSDNPIRSACAWAQVFLAEGYGLTPDNNPEAYDITRVVDSFDRVAVPNHGYLGGFIDGFDGYPHEDSDGLFMEDPGSLYSVGYEDGLAARKEFLDV